MKRPENKACKFSFFPDRIRHRKVVIDLAHFRSNFSPYLVVFALGKSPVFRVDRAGAAIIGASLTVGLGVIDFDQAVRAIDVRTVVLLFAMMIIVSYLNLSGFFLVAGNYFLRRLRTRKQLLMTVIMMTGILSAFFINDIVFLLLTPIVI
jgi:Na+/H+ antiporter NhaD/arsenite permease-like protein